jgi:hypothetical protein
MEVNMVYDTHTSNYLLEVSDQTKFKRSSAKTLHTINSHTNQQLFYKLQVKLSSHQPIRVGVIGGSNSKGTSFSNKTQIYPEKIIQWLNRNFPVHHVDRNHTNEADAESQTAQHVLLNRAVGGSGSGEHPKIQDNNDNNKQQKCNICAMHDHNCYP